jgi:preprotein translocase subunit SecE
LEKKIEITDGNPAVSAPLAKPAVVQKKVVTVTKQKAAGVEKNFIQNSVQFLREVKIELKKVTWPSRKQTMGFTVVVIILVVIISLFLGVVDFGLSNLIRAVLP